MQTEAKGHSGSPFKSPGIDVIIDSTPDEAQLTDGPSID
jgi:hypothetical protein